MVAKYIFPFAIVTDGCKEANYIGFSHEIGILNTIFLKENFRKNRDFIENIHEIYLFATFSHGCKEENILCSHDKWLQS